MCFGDKKTGEITVGRITVEKIRKYSMKEVASEVTLGGTAGFQ